MTTLDGLRVALVHDWLTGMRGGERVLEVFCELFPSADVYTLIHVPGRVSPTIERHPIHTSFLQRIPGAARRYRHFLPLFPAAIERFRLSGYDLVLSSSHAVAKGIPVPPGALHVCYLHAPMRYMWDGFDAYFGPGRASLPVRLAARAVRPYLRRWDVRSARRVHRFLVNSRNIQEQVRRIYGRESRVVYPPVSLERFTPSVRKSDYYLMVGAFAPNKRVDDAIVAFNRLRRPLKIVGTGQDEARCRELAGPSVEFLGEQDDAAIERLYREARAFIFPGVDDFGITPLEAQASGTPVIALAAGGALETVTAETGILYEPAGPDALVEAVQRFEAQRGTFTAEACALNAMRFGRPRFAEEMRRVLEEAWEGFRGQTPGVAGATTPHAPHR